MPTRREFLKKAAIQCGALSALPLISLGCQQKKPPNIVWIIGDDLSPDLGCYGHNLVYTPNIDRLAGEGLRFENAFVTSPVCSPSRSAFYTGMYQTSIGVHQHRTFNVSPLPPPVKVITEYFRQAGYFTSNGYGTPDSRPGKTDFNFEVDEPFDGTDWSQRQPGQPFFASVQMNEAHRTFVQDTENPIDPENVQLPPYYPEHPVSRKDWSNYLETVQVLDKNVGKILKRLDDEGLADDTVVIFFGDHGRPHLRGKQWLYEGGIRVPLIIRWPGQIEPGTVSDELVSMIDLAPTCMNIAGIKPPAHLQGQDFLRNKLTKRDYIFAARDRCDAVVDRIRCVRTEQFKYIRNFYPERPYTQFGHYKSFYYPMLPLMQMLHKQGKLTPSQSAFMADSRPAEELYDLLNDPHELHNLAADSAYQTRLEEMRQILETWMQETNDQGAKDPDDYEALLERRREKYGERWKERGIDPHKTPPEVYVKWWENELGIQ